MPRTSAAAIVLATMLVLLAGCKFPTLAQQQTPSTAAGIENDLAASLPASNAGWAPPIMVTTPTR